MAAPGDQLAAAQEEHGSTAQTYMASVRNLLQMSSSSLADVPGKVVFCRQRITQVGVCRVQRLVMYFATPTLCYLAVQFHLN